MGMVHHFLDSDLVVDYHWSARQSVVEELLLNLNLKHLLLHHLQLLFELLMSRMIEHVGNG